MFRRLYELNIIVPTDCCHLIYLNEDSKKSLFSFNLFLYVRFDLLLRKTSTFNYKFLECDLTKQNDGNCAYILRNLVLYSGGGDNDDECDHKSLL